MLADVTRAARRRRIKNANPQILLAASHGGHLSELLELVDYNPSKMRILTYDSARTRRIPGAVLIPNIGRNPIRMGSAFIKALVLVVVQKPCVVISTGSEIAIPVLLAAWLVRIPTVFIESCTRIRMPTFTGKTVYPFVTLFLTQSEELRKAYGGKATYEGGLV